MEVESNKKLRLDRRLLRRRGWISPKELDAAFEALPDASDKVAPPEEATEPAESVESAPAAAAPDSPTPADPAAPPAVGGGTPEGGVPV
ncbi:MAG: hypothetical protein ACQGVK_21585 [Myxococcota bacterium]